eukprot:12226210-Karenia_brevis.AAC.1
MRAGTSRRGVGMQGMDLLDYLSSSYQVEGHHRLHCGKGVEVLISWSQTTWLYECGRGGRNQARTEVVRKKFPYGNV